MYDRGIANVRCVKATIAKSAVVSAESKILITLLSSPHDSWHRRLDTNSVDNHYGAVTRMMRRRSHTFFPPPMNFCVRASSQRPYSASSVRASRA